MHDSPAGVAATCTVDALFPGSPRRRDTPTSPRRPCPHFAHISWAKPVIGRDHRDRGVDQAFLRITSMPPGAPIGFEPHGGHSPLSVGRGLTSNRQRTRHSRR